MKKMVYIVDDEEDILELVSLHLERIGFKAKGFLDASSFFRGIKKRLPDLIILDIMLPEVDGLEICKQLKMDHRYSHVPIIMLTAKCDETDKILGLELGADDYVTKPFSPKELVVRVKVALRKTIQQGAGKRVVIGDLVIEPEQYNVMKSGKKIELTTTEFKILLLLANGRGIVFSREKMLAELWGEENEVLDRTIDVHIRNLREKLGRAGEQIKNIRGVGYKLE